MYHYVANYDLLYMTKNLLFIDNTPESLNPSVVYDEEGLPSPPLDEGALFAAQTTTIQLSGVYDVLFCSLVLYYVQI